MRISQLAQQAGLPTATVKFYLREGLLHEGTLTSPTQAQYDESHVERLALIRALVGPANQSIASARRILEAIETPPPSAHDLLGIAHEVVTPHVQEQIDVSRARRMLDDVGWNVADCEPQALASLEIALDALIAGGFELSDEVFARYARAMMGIATDEVDDVPTSSPEAAARFVILGTVLIEPLLLSLRRLAQQAASARRFGGSSSAGARAEVLDRNAAT